MLIAGLALALWSSAASAPPPTAGKALKMAERVAAAEGYDLRDRHRYFFDPISGKGGRPFMTGYATYGFYWDGDTIDTISVHERTGLTVDPVACVIFDYPAVRAGRRGYSGGASPSGLMADLKSHSGCAAFTTRR